MKSTRKVWYADRPWSNIRFIYLGIIDVLDGLIMIITAGEWQPCLGMKYLVWEVEREAKKYDREKQTI